MLPSPLPTAVEAVVNGGMGFPGISMEDGGE